jgi:hypothetical protein
VEEVLETQKLQQVAWASFGVGHLVRVETTCTEEFAVTDRDISASHRYSVRQEHKTGSQLLENMLRKIPKRYTLGPNTTHGDIKRMYSSHYRSWLLTLYKELRVWTPE